MATYGFNPSIRTEAEADELAMAAGNFTIVDKGDGTAEIHADVSGTKRLVVSGEPGQDGAQGPPGLDGAGASIFGGVTRFVAHRGRSKYAPELTIQAYEQAGIWGFWGAECDIVYTSDNVAILMHDLTVDRTTSGTGTVAGKTLAQIKALTITGGEFVSFYPGCKVPTLEEFLVACIKWGMVPVVEIKGINSDANITGTGGLVEILRKYNLEERCVVIADSHTHLQLVRSASEKIHLQTIKNLSTTTISQMAALGNAGVDSNYTAVTEALVKQAHAAGLTVGAWTVDDYTQARNLIAMGVDAITTNHIVLK